MLSLLNLVSTVIQLYIYALFIFIILGWLVQFNVINSQNRFVYLVMDFLYRVTEPLLRPIRNVLPNLGGLDISPIVLVLGLSFLRSLMWEYLG
ncbi:YggT family protein [Nisaea nitritireducens]|uniref:YggT family protein n=1 Tax=Nisaea nitritireducens TaxID=568392 RepID=UPI0018685C7B|nr:YggT family protein [Nisaea nitritireducens]|tara:strand:- start:1140 stop:1418 length:279 start_codon:yes stop_codon:yes gene_type:complete